MASTDLIMLETTVESIAGSAVTLASVAGLAVGDRIIIESTHGYGETGLDGVWSISGAPAQGSFYYTDAPVGKSFIATVNAISGTTVTLSRTAPAEAVGKTVYRDNHAAVKDAIENKLTWPRGGRYACAMEPSPVRAYLTDDYHEINFNHCELFAPRGCQAMCLRIYRLGGGGVSNKVYKNLTIRGNVRSAGYGFSIETGVYYQGSSLPTAFSLNGTGGAGGNIASNVRVDNFTFIDNWRAMDVVLANGAEVSNCVSILTDVQHHYVQWEFMSSSASNTVFRRCNIDTSHARPGFEAFKSSGVTFSKCRGRNVLFSCNTSGNVIYEDCSTIWDEENPGSAFSPYNPLFNINRTIENQQGTPQTGTEGGVRVRNFVAEYVNVPYPDTNRIFNTISVAPGIRGINTAADIQGVTLTVPRTNLTTPSAGYIVRSDDAASFASGLVGQLDSGSKYVKNNVSMN